MDQNNITLPKLQVVKEKPNRKKILLLSDDLRMNSGIATMSREFVIKTSDIFNWVQLAAALDHPEHGKIFDVSADVGKERGIPDADVKVYAHNGYGNQNVLREIILLEKPDAILHFTDPRFWEWLYRMEHEIRAVYKIPIMYYNIWDAPPAPFWNEQFYKSCDLIMNISKQTHNLVKMVVGDTDYVDLDTSNPKPGKILVSYVPHGINHDKFFPIDETHPEYPEFKKLENKFKNSHNVDFVIFWNNRNIRRKQPGDVVLAYRQFCDRLPKEESKRVALLMHTAMRDPNGTDIPEVVRVMCPDYKVIFNEEQLPTNVLNYFYNIADITINMSSNEGFGLATAESIMAGTPVVVNVTGGLQDQVRFTDENGKWINFTPEYTSNHTGRYKNHGEWARVVYPTNRSLQGSPMTPYILDDRCDYNDVADAMFDWYTNSTAQSRTEVGKLGREWMMSEECGMDAEYMGSKIATCINKCLGTFKPKPKFELIKVVDKSKIENPGLVWK